MYRAVSGFFGAHNVFIVCCCIIIYSKWSHPFNFNTSVFQVISQNCTCSKQRSCRRFPGNQGWWENVWCNYSEKRFIKKNFRVSQATFLYILSRIQADNATVHQKRMLRLKNSRKNLESVELQIGPTTDRLIVSSETNTNRTCTIHDPHD